MIRIIILALAVATPAVAGDYYLVGESESRDLVSYIDESRITVGQNGVRTVWIDSFFSQAKKHKLDYDSDKQFIQFNCGTQTKKSLRFIYYSAKGEIVDDADMTFNSIERAVVPDSIGEAELKFVCEEKHDPDMKAALSNGETIQHYAEGYIVYLNRSAGRRKRPSH